jgi:hypothetical protein
MNLPLNENAALENAPDFIMPDLNLLAQDNVLLKNGQGVFQAIPEINQVQEGNAPKDPPHDPTLRFHWRFVKTPHR